MEQLEKIAKQQLLCTRICAILLALILVVVLVPTAMLLPQATQTMAHIETISQQLSQINWAQLSGNIDALLQTSSETLGQLDIEAFNKAIQDLRTSIAPLVKLFG